MNIKNSVKKKYLNEYKKVLIYTPYDEFLMEVYENSKPHFKENRNGRLILSKRKKYDKIVKEFIKEINDNFNDYVNDDNESIEKINLTAKGDISDFSSFKIEKIIELATKLSENSWEDDNSIIINDTQVNIK